MKHNFHSHTFHCKHSSLSIDETIERAISLGFTKWGFSEHVWMKGAGDERMSSLFEMEEFISDIKRAKEKYKDQIQILCGIECEIDNPYNNESNINVEKSLETRNDIDYSILGNHIYWGTEFAPKWPQMTKDEIEHHINNFELAAKNFKKLIFFAHPDSYLSAYETFNEEAEYIANRIIDIAIKYDKPLGVNANGLHSGKAYPSSEFFNLVGKRKAKVVLELDSHSLDIITEEVIEKVESFAKKHNLNVVEL